MKSKKHRKNLISASPQKLKKIQEQPAFKIKFNLSIDNLSCFISSRQSVKKYIRRSSQSKNHHRRSQNKTQKQLINRNLGKKQAKSKRAVDSSPDIPRQFSNSIIQAIEKKGITCPWNQIDDTFPFKDSQNQISNEDIWTVFSNQFNKSYASTNDFPNYHTYTYCNYQLNNTHKSRTDSNIFTIQVENIGNDQRTTIMIRNIPNKYSISELAEEVDENHRNCYDFLYLPCDFNNQCNVGYGFINFVSTESLRSFYCKFHSYIWKKYKSQKICALTYARLQGLNQLIQHFENSKVLNQKDKKYRPIIKYDKIHQMVLAQQKRSIYLQ